MVEQLGIDKSKITELGNLMYKNYGTTMAGLRAIGYDFDYDEYHSFVHGRLPYENLKPDPVLRSLLMGLLLRKICVRQGQGSRLAFEDCFEGIICFETLNPTHKNTVSDDEDDIEFMGSTVAAAAATANINNSSTQILDIIGNFAQALSPTRIWLAYQRLPLYANHPNMPLSVLSRSLTLTLKEHCSLKIVSETFRPKSVWGCTPCCSQRVKGADFALESIHNIRDAIRKYQSSRRLTRNPKLDISENLLLKHL
ncbi:hypothetical protein Ddye_010896 [Dipteronia dyeriana]|uniref:Uncharacterized protein n=1 Tax=Dipteronia dyeriana TaxID=168575 RepID=A0AAD9XE85_9ROSI|nr:hypothetical protein Ddye_010896 [Dipteronia dyeriana]